MSRLELPAQTFDMIALDLKLYADSAHNAVLAGEVMLARGGWAEGMRHHTMDELRAAAEIAGALHEFFKAAAQHEVLIRDFVAGLASVTPFPMQQRRAL